MTSALSGSLAPIVPAALALALHGVRLLPAALLCPLLGGPMVPPVVRLTLAFGLGACAWSAAGASPFAGSGAVLLQAAFREVGLGITLAVVSTIPFEAARAGGRLVDTLRGATLTDLHVAPLRQRESAIGDLLAQWAVVLAATTGGDRLVVAALLETFRAVPAGIGIPGSMLLGTGVRAMAELIACAVALGTPAAAGVLAADLACTAASRAAPQLQITTVAQPARAALGLVAIGVPAAMLAGRLVSTVALSAHLLGQVARPLLP